MHPSWLCIQHMSEKDPGQSHANEFLANLKPMSPLGKDRSLRWVAGAGGFWQSLVRGCYIQSAKLVFWYHKKSSFHRYSKNAAFLQLKRIGEAFTLKQQQHLPWERNSKKIKGSCSAHATPHMKDSRMLSSAINTLFCGHYRGREEAFVERVKSGWIDYLPNSKDVLCFGNFVRPGPGKHGRYGGMALSRDSTVFSLCKQGRGVSTRKAQTFLVKGTS